MEYVATIWEVSLVSGKSDRGWPFPHNHITANITAAIIVTHPISILFPLPYHYPCHIYLHKCKVKTPFQRYFLKRQVSKFQISRKACFPLTNSSPNKVLTSQLPSVKVLPVNVSVTTTNLCIIVSEKDKPKHWSFKFFERQRVVGRPLMGDISFSKH